eukprot:353683-Chlamydomonas_euryale.AAC.1
MAHTSAMAARAQAMRQPRMHMAHTSAMAARARAMRQPRMHTPCAPSMRPHAHARGAPHARSFAWLAAGAPAGAHTRTPPTLCDLVNHVAARVHLPQRQLVVVLVVQHIEQVRVERVDVLNLGKFVEDGA